MNQPPRKLRIAIAVHGRYHVFDAARALLELGHDVEVFTNLPAFVAKPFNIPSQRIHTLLVHGVLSRIATHLRLFNYFEPSLNRLFGRRVAQVIARHANRYGAFDVVHIFSGVAEELLQHPEITGLKTLLRGSAHIAVQHQLLVQEAQRMQQSVDVPSAWMIAREQREYALCDRVVVMSSFARRSFIDQGFPAQRLLFGPAGAHTGDFHASAAQRQRRAERIASGAPLTVLLVGTLSARKGILDLMQVVNALSDRMHFRFVGTVAPDARVKLPQRSKLELLPRVAQQALPNLYAQADVFLHPTIEDGFAVVLVQALMAGLPVICTENCAASDVVAEGKTGFVVPIRAPDAMIAKLEYLHKNRVVLNSMLENLARSHYDFSWLTATRVFVDEHLRAIDEMHQLMPSSK